MSFTSNKVRLRGKELFVRRAGTGSPVVFVHGTAGVLSWQPFFDKIAENHEIFVPDLPGFGSSDTPDSLHNLQDMAYLLLEFLESTVKAQVDVIAHSLGGWVVAEAAVRTPAAFRSISFIAPAGIRSEGVAQPDIFSWSPRELVENLFFDERFVKATLNAPATPELGQMQAKNAATAAKLARLPQLYNPDLAHLLHNIKCPVQLIWGADDKIIPAAYAKSWCEQLPNLKLIILQKCGHLPQVEQSEACTSAILEFLTNVKTMA